MWRVALFVKKRSADPLGQAQGRFSTWSPGQPMLKVTATFGELDLSQQAGTRRITIEQSAGSG